MIAITLLIQRLELLEIAPKERMLPHAGVHGWSEQHGFLARQREQHRQEQLVGNSVRQPTNEVERRRRHHDDVCPAADRDVLDRRRLARAPRAVASALAGGRGKRERRHELRGGAGQHRDHAVAGAHQLADEVARLVGGNAAGDADQDVLARLHTIASSLSRTARAIAALPSTATHSRPSRINAGCRPPAMRLRSLTTIRSARDFSRLAAPTLSSSASLRPTSSLNFTRREYGAQSFKRSTIFGTGCSLSTSSARAEPILPVTRSGVKS